jgi:hypothetical protein
VCELPLPDELRLNPAQVQGPLKVHELESTVAALMARCAELEARLQSQVL